MLPELPIKNTYSGNSYLATVMRSRIILAVVFFSSLAIRYHEYYTFREFNSDKARQLHGAYELMQGRGVSFVSYNLNTFQPLVKPIIDWPPVYSYMAAGISYVTHTNLYTASVVADVLCLLALWLTLLWLSQLLAFNTIQKVLLFVFLGLSKTLIGSIYSADLIGSTLFLFACCVNIRYTQEPDKQRRGAFFALQFCLIAIMVFFKYSLFPAAASLGISLFTYGSAAKNKRFRTAAFYLLALFIASIGLLLLRNSLISGYSTMYTERSMGDGRWHFGNLLLFNPFIMSSFFYLQPLYQRMNWQIVNAITVPCSIAIFGWIIWDAGKRMINKKADYYDHLCLITILAVTGFIALLSIRYPRAISNGIHWTYVMEFRYFAPACFLVIIYFFKNFKIRGNRNFRSLLLSSFVAASVAVTVLLSAYYWVIDNKASSFASLYGKVVKAADYATAQKGNNTYFVSLSNNMLQDAQITSLAAIQGVKVVVNYYGYFPDSTFNVLFARDAVIAPGKKVLVYIGQNTAVLNRINPRNHYRIEKDADDGAQFLIIEN